MIEMAGAEVAVPRSQHCCGLPAFDAGDWTGATHMLRQTLEAFAGYDMVVTSAPSCLAAIAHEYDALVENDPVRRAGLNELRSRLFDLLAFLECPGRPPGGVRLESTHPGSVGVHRFCQSRTSAAVSAVARRSTLRRFLHISEYLSP